MIKKFILENICWKNLKPNDDATETYYFNYNENMKDRNGFTVSEERQAETFLQDICFCDDYEIISIKEAETEAIEKYNNSISELEKRNIEFSDMWEVDCLLYVKGYYETIEEMIEDNL